MKFKLHCIALYLLFGVAFLNLSAQKYTISGVLKDAASGETIIGANVVVKKSGFLTGATTNMAGFYSITLEKGNYKLIVDYMGYHPFEIDISLEKNMTLPIELNPLMNLINEVIVRSERSDFNVSSVDIGKMELKIEAIKKMPAFMGEVDILKSIQLLPGIQSGSEGNTGFFVRGGNADQNLILLDEAPVYNPSHLFGFFSIFNADAVKNVEIVKSGMPANYGGRLASILDVYQKEGNMKKFELDGGLGLIFSRLTVQGPIKKDRCSFIISGRRTYIDVLAQPFIKKSSPFKGSKFYFYDFNGKINIIVNDKHRIYIGGYYGSDTYGFNSTGGTTGAQFSWGNGIGAIRWNYIISPKLFLNTSATFSDYAFKTGMKMDVYNFTIGSGVRDYSVKTELTLIPNPNHNLKFGIHNIFHTFFPTKYDIEAGNNNQLALPASAPYYGNELALYVNDEWTMTKWLKINIGGRYSNFKHLGPFTRYVLDSFGYITDSILYKRGKSIQSYHRFEPRFAARFLLDSNTSVKASYTLNYQYLHQISMASVSLPTDVWMPVTSIVKPQEGHQFTLGVFRNFLQNMLETSIDAYFKQMSNLVEYKDGLDFASLTSNPDQMYTFGKGYSWGIEFYLNKTKGRFNGFASYTLSYTKRKFSELNCSEWFYAKYDRRHDVSINLNYEIIPQKLSVSVVWIFASGNTMTVPVGYYFFAGTLMTEYSDRNAYRLEPYHRLDFSVNWNIVKKKHFETGLNFSVYNVYNRKNPFFIFYETTTDFSVSGAGIPSFDFDTKAYKISLFPIIPSITWNFKIK